MQAECRFRACAVPIVLSLILVSAATATEAAERQAYEPAAEIVLPPSDVNVPRAVEEKDGYAYLLTREGTLYTYDISDLPLRTSFATYDTPVRKQTAYNGNGVLRCGDYLYAFGGSGIQTIDVRNPSMPALLGSSSELNIYNLVRHEDYLIAAGAERLVVYSIAEPSNPALLSDFNLGQEVLVWSVAAYGRTLYVCHWWSDWQDTCVNTLSVIDFSDPAHLAVLKAIRRDDQAYHLRVIGDRLLECTSNQVGLWDLTAPADPVLLTSQQGGGRVATLDGPNIVTNGTVFRPDANDLHVVATFAAGGSQQDGFPHGSGVSESFVFLAQTQRILVLNAMRPVLTANHASGSRGSFFSITGADFAPCSTATITVNGSTLGEVATDSAGRLLFLLQTEQADEGSYVVTAIADRSASAGFTIASGEPAHAQEDDGPVFEVPPQIAYGKYSGGNGMAADPYQIATPADLIALGETPEDYDKHFVLTADIDLDPNLPGGRVFDKSVIAPDADDANGGHDGIPFSGVFDGDGHAILHLTVTGGSSLGLFGRVAGHWAEVRNLGMADVYITGSSDFVGGLAGHNDGHIAASYSSGSVSGTFSVGGLVGRNSGSIANCYSAGSVTGDWGVGGLVGQNAYSIATSYSSVTVSGTECVGGLAGYQRSSRILSSFWDTQISGQASSAGGVGKTTAEMQTASTFSDAGWDFVGETENGTDDIWCILEGQDYPRLWWEATELTIDD